MMDEARVVVSSNQVSTDLGDEIAILNLDSGVYYGLSDVGACIWNFMGEPRDRRAKFSMNVCYTYDVSPDRLHSDLIELLNELADSGLIEVCDGNIV